VTATQDHWGKDFDAEVGTRVRVVALADPEGDAEYAEYVGQEGEITETKAHPNFVAYRIRFADGEQWWFASEELGIVSAQATERGRG
jgi:hypothetical protein